MLAIIFYIILGYFFLKWLFSERKVEDKVTDAAKVTGNVLVTLLTSQDFWIWIGNLILVFLGGLALSILAELVN